MSWTPGAATVDGLLETGAIARLVGADLGVPGLMQRADQQLASAEILLASDPPTAYVVAYDAAKHAAMAVLAEQNLRTTATGGHLALERVLDAQFGGLFLPFSRLRRRRNELDYPSGPEDFADTAETQRAIVAAREIVDHVRELLGRSVLTTF